MYSTQFHTFHQDLHLTPPHYPYIHFTSHPALIPFPSPRLDYLHSTSVLFPSLHFTSLITFQPLFLEIIYFLSTSKTLHFTSLHFTSLHFTSLHFPSLKTFLAFSLYILDFPALQNPLTSLHLSHFSLFSWKYSISSSLWIPFTSLITFTNPLPKGARSGGWSP